MKKLPGIGEYGNFQGEPFSTDHDLDYRPLIDYMKKDQKYPFLSYLNMDIKNLEVLDDRIERKGLDRPENIEELPPEEINKDLEKDSNYDMNGQGQIKKEISLEKKEELLSELDGFENEIQRLKELIKKI